MQNNYFETMADKVEVALHEKRCTKGNRSLTGEETVEILIPYLKEVARDQHYETMKEKHI